MYSHEMKFSSALSPEASFNPPISIYFNTKEYFLSNADFLTKFNIP